MSAKVYLIVWRQNGAMHFKTVEAEMLESTLEELKNEPGAKLEIVTLYVDADGDEDEEASTP